MPLVDFHTIIDGLPNQVSVENLELHFIQNYDLTTSGAALEELRQGALQHSEQLQWVTEMCARNFQIGTQLLTTLGRNVAGALA